MGGPKWLVIGARHLCTISSIIALTMGVVWPAAAADISLSERLKVLERSYPGKITQIDSTTVRMADGSKLTIDDGRNKSHAEKLVAADIEDMLSQIYPTLECKPIDDKASINFDPGRIRDVAFFKSVYGSSDSEVRRKLVPIDWFGQRLLVTSEMGVARKLAAVKDELQQFWKQYSAFLVPSAGTFMWRKIAGTRRLSAHSFGIAIDLAAVKSDYWRWSGGKPGHVPNYHNKIPREIVAAFERHGFIWGGRWYHFDTMHFEYRPELIAIGNLALRRHCFSD